MQPQGSPSRSHSWHISLPLVLVARLSKKDLTPAPWESFRLCVSPKALEKTRRKLLAYLKFLGYHGSSPHLSTKRSPVTSLVSERVGMGRKSRWDKAYIFTSHLFLPGFSEHHLSSSPLPTNNPIQR